MTRHTPYHQLIIFVVIYFFFNSLLLPEGLLYTTLLTPLMVYFLFKEHQLKRLMVWSLALMIPIPFQWIHGVEIKSYAISSLMIVTVLIFLVTALLISRKYRFTFDKIFRKILVINTVFVLLALVILPFGEVRGLLWYEVPITKGMAIIPRLKLFTYEASYYALIMMPVFLYFMMRVFYGLEKHAMLIILASVVPLLLSASFGVIGALIIALLVGIIFYWNRIPVSLKRFTFLSTIFMLTLLILMWMVWPENPIYFRIQNIFQGKDTSAMGRLVYSFMFAYDIIVQHNFFFGIGPGQIKIIAHDMIVNHYQYHGDLETIVRIPNSMAEMMAIYGMYGFIFKLFLEIYFFIRMRIYNNLYVVILFIFIFIYQFTGSFISNIAEIGIWAFIFGLQFTEFNTNITTK
jgi:hypothetical protein